MIIQRKYDEIIGLLPFVFLIFFFSFSNIIIAQEQLSKIEDTSDSLSLQITFDIKLLELEILWPNILNISEFSEIIELKIFAVDASKEKDFSLALIYLDEIFSIIDEKTNITPKETSVENLDFKPAQIVTVFEKEVLTGLDFSKQEYHLTYSEEDTAYIETINNPFGGLKLRWNQYLLNEFDFE